MTITRSFGTNFTFPGGAARSWHAGRDGIRRWCDNGQRVDSDTDFIAAMSADLPPIHAPRSLDEMAELETSEGILALQSDNTDIDVSESALYPGETK
mgnify:CR=1 FL=1